MAQVLSLVGHKLLVWRISDLVSSNSTYFFDYLDNFLVAVELYHEYHNISI